MLNVVNRKSNESTLQFIAKNVAFSVLGAQSDLWCFLFPWHWLLFC